MSAFDMAHNSGRCLLVQLARFGDLMQTAPVVAGLRRAGYDEVHLLVQEDLASIAGLIEGVERVWTLRRGEWLRVLRSRRASLLDWMNMIQNETAAIRAVEFSKIVNITHSRESAYITSLLGGERAAGLVGMRCGMQSVSLWEDCFQAAIRRRSANRFNLVDYHLRLAGVPGEVTSGFSVKVEPQLQENFAEELGLAAKERKLVIGLQLGANSPLRTWGVNRWFDAAMHISCKSNVVFALFGSAMEASLAEAFIDGFRGAAKSFVGRTTLETLPSLVGLCGLVLGGDTGTMHLAAAMGVPTISVFLAMARPQETAPYGSGRLVFCSRRECCPCAEQSKCMQPRCHDDVPPEAVADAALGILRQRRGWSYAPGNYRLLKTAFNAEGFQILTELFPNLNARSKRKTSYSRSDQELELQMGGLR